MVHPTSLIEDGAIIADDVTIGPFCHIGKDVTIKSGAKIESNVIMKGKVVIDQEVRIFSFTTIGHESSNVKIGKKTHIREFCQIGVQEPLQGKSKKIIIGTNCFLMGYVQILSGVHIKNFCILTNAVILHENVHCDDRVVIGGFSNVLANNKIGTGVMIGGASFINHDMPPFTLIEGNHSEIKGINVIGLRRRVDNKDDIEEIKLIFKKIIRESTPVDKELAAHIAKTHDNKYVKLFGEFVANSNL